MTKVLVLYYSSYGHIATMAQAVAEGARSVPGTEVAVKRVPELVPADVRKASHFQEEPNIPVATPDELADYDAVIIGVPTRFGNMPGQMKNFLDQTGGLWMKGALIGKVGSVFTASATQHGGQESTILTTHTTLLHQGMVIVGLPYSFAGQMGVDEVMGNTPYGASTIAGGDGSRQPSAVELDGARFQGKHVAEIAAKLAGGADVPAAKELPAPRVPARDEAEPAGSAAVSSPRSVVSALIAIVRRAFGGGATKLG